MRTRTMRRGGCRRSPGPRTIIGALKAQILRSLEGRKFAATDQLIQELREKGVFDVDFRAYAVQFLERELVREVLRTKGDDGYPLFPNIAVMDPATGKKQNLYMREDYMKSSQYQQVGDYWKDYAHYGQSMANETYKRCNARYNTQFSLPFPEAPALSDVKDHPPDD
jgi:hypothetical protein